MIRFTFPYVGETIAVEFANGEFKAQPFWAAARLQLVVDEVTRGGEYFPAPEHLVFAVSQACSGDYVLPELPVEELPEGAVA